MNRTNTVLALACVLIAGTAATGSLAQTISGKIARVIDGDTFVYSGLAIRLCGVDAPERGEPGAAASAQALDALIGGKMVTCTPVGAGTVCDGRSENINGKRVVAQCSVDGIDIAAEQVRRGHACDWPRFSGNAYRGGCVK